MRQVGISNKIAYLALAGALLLFAGCVQNREERAPGPDAAPTAAAPSAPSPEAGGAAPSLPLFTHGVASGDVTGDSAVLWTRTAAAASLIPELAETPAFDPATALPPVRTEAAHDFTVKALAQGLRPGVQYFYRFRSGGAVSPAGAFRTAYAPQANVPVTLAFTGDADWNWKPYPLLNSVAKEKLDFFVFLGDLIYETTNPQGTAAVEDLAGYRAKYRENREPRPGSPSGMTPMLELFQRFGQYAVFDNHEVGLSKADRNAPPYTEGGALFNGAFVNTTPGHRERLQAYAEYVPVREDAVAAPGDPRTDGTRRFYRATPWGANVELIVLDARSYRDIRLPNSDAPAAARCDRTMLGATQFAWAQQALLAAKARGAVWKVVVTSSPLQQLGRSSQIGGDLDGSKSWAGGYGCERNRLLKFIDDNAIDNVVFLTTDNHYTVINNLRYNTVPENPRSPLRPARNAFEILTGPLGAGFGVPFGLKVTVAGLAQREADRRMVDVWNGDLPNTVGDRRGLKQAGLDPIGLEPDFPGLVPGSVRAAGLAPGEAPPLAFVSFNSFTYAVLAADRERLTVRVKGFPGADPLSLFHAEELREYEAREAQELLRFEVRAQP